MKSLAVAVVINSVFSCNNKEVKEFSKFCTNYERIVSLNDSASYDEAFNEIALLIKNTKIDTFPVLFEEYRALIGKRDTLHALNKLYTLNEKYPGKVNVNYNLANIYFNLNKYDSAIFYIDKAIHLKGGENWYLESKSFIYCGIANDDIPMEELRLVRGLSLLNSGYIKQSKDDFIFCIFRNNYEPEYTYSSLAYVYTFLGNTDSAKYFQHKAETILEQRQQDNGQ